MARGGTGQMARGGPNALNYVFPCGHVFHEQCLIACVTSCTTKTEAERKLDLQRRFIETTKSSGPFDMPELYDAVERDCPYCGDLMINAITRPFVGADELDELASWESSKCRGTITFRTGRVELLRIRERRWPSPGFVVYAGTVGHGWRFWRW